MAGSTRKFKGGRIEFDYDQFQAIRDLGADIAHEEAEKLRKRADNYPYPADTRHYRVVRGDRNRSFVRPSSPHAVNSNFKHNTLFKLAGGGQ